MRSFTRRAAWLLAFWLGARLASAPAAQAAEPTLFDTVSQAILQARETYIAVRRDLHQHPELSGSEARTSTVVAERLRARGLEVRTAIAGHGVIAILRGGSPGPTIVFRADMDAMPSSAPDPVPFRSGTPGVRHICGHDVHTTVGLALAESLASVAPRLHGTVVFVLQPAEETATGARAMIDAGAFEGIEPSAFLAFHTAPLRAGFVSGKAGAMLPARDRVTVAARGAANERDWAQSVRAALAALGTTTSGGSLPDPFVVVQGDPTIEWVGRASEWRVSANLTVSDPEARQAARRSLEAALAGNQIGGSAARIEWVQRVPGATNDPSLEAMARASIQRALGPEAFVVSSAAPTAFSEDFGWYRELAPTVMYWLGVGNPEAGYSGVPHSPDYVADETAIETGARAMAAVILDLLQPPAR